MPLLCLLDARPFWHHKLTRLNPRLPALLSVYMTPIPSSHVLLPAFPRQPILYGSSARCLSPLSILHRAGASKMRFVPNRIDPTHLCARSSLSCHASTPWFLADSENTIFRRTPSVPRALVRLKSSDVECDIGDDVGADSSLD